MIKLLSARTIAVLVASVASYLLLVATASGVLNAAEIKVLSGAAVKPVMSELIPQFERLSGRKVTIDYAPTAPVVVNRIEKGEAVDVAIASREGIASLVKQGRVTGGSAVDIAKVDVGAMVCKGAPKPDISSFEASSARCSTRNPSAMPRKERLRSTLRACLSASGSPSR